MFVLSSLCRGAALNLSQFAELPPLCLCNFFFTLVGHGYKPNSIKSNVLCKFTARSIVWFSVNACTDVTYTYRCVCCTEKRINTLASSLCSQLLPALLQSLQCCQETCLACSSFCDWAQTSRILKVWAQRQKGNFHQHCCWGCTVIVPCKEGI